MTMKKSKKGITLVESVLAVVILAILSTGVISLLSVGGSKIAIISKESSTYAEAVQKLDLVISALSNGGEFDTDGSIIFPAVADDETPEGGSEPATSEKMDLGSSTLTYETDLNSDNTIRGWYLTLTMSYPDPSNKPSRTSTVTVKGYASNTKGGFDY